MNPVPNTNTHTSHESLPAPPAAAQGGRSPTGAAAGGAGRDSCDVWVLVLGTGFMVFGLPYPVSKEFGGGILFIGNDFTGRKTHFGVQVAQPKFTLEASFFRATVQPPLQ